jgi:cytochrome P450
MKWGWSTALTPYGETWRMKRKLLHSQIHSDVIEPFRPIQAASARRLARDILRTKTDPQALSDAIRLNFGQTIMKSVYGVDVHSHEDSYIALPAEIIEYFSEAVTPGRFLIDAIPLREFHDAPGVLCLLTR